MFKYDLSGFVIEFGYKNMNYVELTGNENAKSIEEEVLSFIEENGKITIAELIRKTNTSKSIVGRCIYKLKKEKKLERAGSDKGGFWKLL